jgi:hypothetical protein
MFKHPLTDAGAAYGLQDVVKQAAMASLGATLMMTRSPASAVGTSAGS